MKLFHFFHSTPQSGKNLFWPVVEKTSLVFKTQEACVDTETK